MPRNGLNKQIILKNSIQLIEQNGFENFSMRELAKTLDINAASLYNHIENMDELLALISDYALEQLNEQEFSAIEGLDGEQAIFALARAYRDFAKTHSELYHTIMNIFKSHNPSIERSGMKITLPFFKILDGYPLNDDQKAHWQRIFRSILHGFVSQEEAGYFSHYPIDEEDTFLYGVQSFVDGLHAFIKRGSEV